MKISAEEARFPVRDLSKAEPWVIGKFQLSAYKHVPSGDWLGKVDAPTRSTAFFRNSDFDALVAEMEAVTDRPPPKIIGYSGAIARFRQIYPAGIGGTAFDSSERCGKLEAGKVLARLYHDQTPDSEAIAALRLAKRTLDAGKQAPLHMLEAADLEAVWAGDKAGLFVRGLRSWIAGDRPEGFRLLHRACDGRRASWPMFTIFPGLADPNKDAILRPNAVKTFATAVRSSFLQIYESSPSLPVYEAFLQMLDQAAEAIVEERPRDYVDLASFLWVATSYPADTPPWV
jgi:hypothetical protein